MQRGLRPQDGGGLQSLRLLLRKIHLPFTREAFLLHFTADTNLCSKASLGGRSEASRGCGSRQGRVRSSRSGRSSAPASSESRQQALPWPEAHRCSRPDSPECPRSTDCGSRAGIRGRCCPRWAVQPPQGSDWWCRNKAYTDLLSKESIHLMQAHSTAFSTEIPGCLRYTGFGKEGRPWEFMWMFCWR